MSVCRVCEKDSQSARFCVREMMYGTRESFDYLECEVCGCIQIVEIPKEMGSFYPSDYYSFEPRAESRLKRALKRARARSALGSGGLIGRLMVSLFGEPEYAAWSRRSGTTLDAKILDVGCGAGLLVDDLFNAGYRDTCGIDPFISEDICYSGGARVYKRGLDEEVGRYDLIMLHHSFEHMPDPGAALRLVAGLLSPGGRILIRVPVAGSYAWRKYGANWIQLDAPRHLFVPSARGMEILAEQAGLTVSDVVYDSRGFQFWGSEEYVRNIGHREPGSYSVNPARSEFSRGEIREFEAMALRLNRDGDGDQACFYLHRS